MLRRTKNDAQITYVGILTEISMVLTVSTDPDEGRCSSELFQIVQCVIEELIPRGSPDPVCPSVHLNGKRDQRWGDPWRSGSSHQRDGDIESECT